MAGKKTEEPAIEPETEVMTAQTEDEALAPAEPPDPPRELRPCGPLDDAYADEVAGRDTVELLGTILAAEKVEVVFSDGASEMASVPPLVVDGQAWNPVMAGLQLHRPFVITGTGEVAETLAGYGLFLDGKQVAWAWRDPPFPIQPGATVNLTGDIVFPG